MNWKYIITEEDYPSDGERVLVWNAFMKEAQILVYNELKSCWLDEDGIDYYDDMRIDIYPAYMRIVEPTV